MTLSFAGDSLSYRKGRDKQATVDSVQEVVDRIGALREK